MSNATMDKFGFPGTMIGETSHWVALLRPQQATLGSLVVVCREPVFAFGDISPEAAADLGRMMHLVEATLSVFSYEKINHLMLMMVDRDVHFHVIPRYQGSRSFADLDVADTAWPGPPDLATFTEPSAQTRDQLVKALRERWQTLAR